MNGHWLALLEPLHGQSQKGLNHRRRHGVGAAALEFEGGKVSSALGPRPALRTGEQQSAAHYKGMLRGLRHLRDGRGQECRQIKLDL